LKTAVGRCCSTRPPSPRSNLIPRRRPIIPVAVKAATDAIEHVDSLRAVVNTVTDTVDNQGRRLSTFRRELEDKLLDHGGAIAALAVQNGNLRAELLKRIDENDRLSNDRITALLDVVQAQARELTALQDRLAFTDRATFVNGSRQLDFASMTFIARLRWLLTGRTTGQQRVIEPNPLATKAVDVRQ
jgi:hypothetical protein